MQDEREELRYWGCSYYYGWDGTQNSEYAFQLLERLRGLGDGFGSYMIGLIQYNYGIYEEAYAYLFEASQRGYFYADYMIANLFENGLGVTKDHTTAMLWYMKAAEEGVEEACEYMIKCCEKYHNTLKAKQQTICATISPEPYRFGDILWVADEVKLVAPNGHLVSLDRESFFKEIIVKPEEDGAHISYFLRDMYSGETVERIFTEKINTDILPPAFDVDSLEYISKGKQIVQNGLVLCEDDVRVRTKIIEQESGLNTEAISVTVNGKSVSHKITGEQNSDYVLEFTVSEREQVCQYTVEIQDQVGHKKVVQSDGLSIPNILIVSDKPSVKFFDDKVEIHSKYKTDEEIKLGAMFTSNNDHIQVLNAILNINGEPQELTIDTTKKGVISLMKISTPGLYKIDISVIDSFNNITEKTIEVEIVKQRLSQFDFLLQVNENAYNSIREAEKKVKRNHQDIGTNIRIALEAIVNDLFKEQYPDDNGDMDLYKKIKKLSDDESLPPIDKLNKSYSRLDGKTYTIMSTEAAYTFIRLYGNWGSHVDSKEHWPVKCYENAILALKVFYKIACGYIKLKTGREITKGFDEHKLPIGDYCVESFKPVQQELTKVTGCEYEYICYRKNSKNKKIYSFIREYKKNQAEHFILRNNMVFDESYNERKRMEAMTYTSNINEINDERSQYYYVVNEIGHNKPQRINKKILSQLGIIEKLKICKSVSDCLAVLHNLDNPIYIRMMNYESIILEKKESGIGAYIVGYDYAKINGQDTVLDKLSAVNQIEHQPSLEKYKAPEFVVISNDDIDDYWEKIDLYSLGVFIRDIISGEPENLSVPNLTELDSYCLGNQMKETLKGLVGIAEKRPSAMEVSNVITEEINHQIKFQTED